MAAETHNRPQTDGTLSSHIQHKYTADTERQTQTHAQMVKRILYSYIQHEADTHTHALCHIHSKSTPNAYTHSPHRIASHRMADIGSRRTNGQRDIFSHAMCKRAVCTVNNPCKGIYFDNTEMECVVYTQ